MTSDTVTMLDDFLSDVRHQSLLDGDKVRDFLLDVRTAVVALEDWIVELHEARR